MLPLSQPTLIFLSWASACTFGQKSELSEAWFPLRIQWWKLGHLSRSNWLNHVKGRGFPWGFLLISCGYRLFKVGLIKMLAAGLNTFLALGPAPASWSTRSWLRAVFLGDLRSGFPCPHLTKYMMMWYLSGMGCHTSRGRGKIWIRICLDLLLSSLLRLPFRSVLCRSAPMGFALLAGK